MSDEAAILAKILSEPDDDTHRLVYADWLDEQGEQTCPKCGGNGRTIIAHAGEPPGAWVFKRFQECGVCKGRGTVPNLRAEFIRVQVELARTAPRLWERGAILGRQVAGGPIVPYVPDGSVTATAVATESGPENPRHAHLRDRERELCQFVKFVGWTKLNCAALGAVQGRWLTPAHPVLGSGVIGNFRRGDVELVVCTSDEWLTHGAAIRAAHPVTRARLTTHSGFPIDQNPTGRVLRYFQRRLGITDVKAFMRNPDGTYSNALWPGLTFELPE